ncbi:RloB family protein [Salegentibacter sp. JZCK2]|uniref:RloB family protein n=1 Tax=Salegentibacter tibetensis TaxID=2873600 RepID=UPI001CD0129B|nr:RloB family protein [Salegentibacter tibetensis]MBZ9729409.1 RloB family protein [Salegentibacter tibetensis]
MIQVSKRILILCEDKKSSLLYLDSFKKDEKTKRDLAAVDIEIYQPRDFSPVGLVTEAKERRKKAKRDRNPYDEVWIVLDKDGHANLDRAVDMAYTSKIKVALSVICFEYWVLLHFEKTTIGFKKCDDVISYIKKNHLADYEKSTNCFLELKDKIGTAIKNGDWLDNQVENDLARGTKPYDLSAYTNMHKLVRKLFEPKKFLF